MMAPFRGGFNAMMQMPTNDPFASLHLSEMIGNTLGKLGVQDLNMIGDDEFDYDNENDSRGDIDDPPFHVGSFLDRDLSLGPPGWYKSHPFTVDFKHTRSLANEHIESCFLCPPTEPKVDQDVVVRVSLPFGGRGYLYGVTTSIGPSPSDDDLGASESFRFEKPCACSNPACVFQTGSRQEILSALGVRHGQEVTAKVGLGSPYLEQKLRFAPLPTFFGGKDTQYDAILRWDDGEIAWNVVKMSKHEEFSA